MTRLYNIFVEAGSAGSSLGPSELELLELLLVHIRSREAEVSALLPFEEFRRIQEQRRVQEAKRLKDAAEREQELKRKNLLRLLPAGVDLRNFEDDSVFIFAPLLLLMLWASLFGNRINLLGLDDFLQKDMRRFSNGPLKFMVIAQGALVALRHDTKGLLDLPDATPLSSMIGLKAFYGLLSAYLPQSGLAELVFITLGTALLFFLFLYEVTQLSFFLFAKRREALASIFFTATYPWFLLPADILLPVLFFGWLFTYTTTSAILLSRYNHNEWKSGIMTAPAAALACLVHPLGLFATLLIPLMAVFGISNSRTAASYFTNWIAWFAAALTCALVLLKIQTMNPSLAWAGIFAGTTQEFMDNLLYLRWLNPSNGSPPHMLLLALALLALLKRRISSEHTLLTLLIIGGALFCAFVPLHPRNALIYSGIPGLAGLAAAPLITDIMDWAGRGRSTLRLLLLLAFAAASIALCALNALR